MPLNTSYISKSIVNALFDKASLKHEYSCEGQSMMRSLAGKSMLLFAVSFVIVIGHTLLDPSLARLSFGVQRLIIFLGIVLPAGIGAVLGILSLVRKEGRIWLAVLGIVLNSLFALFHVLLILFAG